MSFNDGFSVYSIPYVTGSDGQLLTWSSTENRWIPGSGLGSIVSAVSTSNGIVGDGTGGNPVRLDDAITVQNLYVEQTASIAHIDYIFQQSLVVGDKYITLMSGANDHSLMNGAGILWGSGSTDPTTGDQGSTAYILYRNNTRDQLEVFPGLYVSGSLTASSSVNGSLTGSLFANTSSVIDVSSSVVALRITQRGAGDCILVEDTQSVDPNPFVVKNDGKVGIGLAAPISALQINGNLIQGLTLRTFIGGGAHAEGNNTFASGNYSHAEGYYSEAIGYASHAEGQYCVASGNYSHAEGISTIAQGAASHAEGRGTYAVSIGSHAQGSASVAEGPYSRAEGFHTLASGYGSHAEGSYTTASGESSHAEGQFSIAGGNLSHAEGIYTNARGPGSHAEGVYSEAFGDYSHVDGLYTNASGSGSFSSGLCTTASSDFQNVIGICNEIKTDALHIIGNGDYTLDIINKIPVATVNSRSNILEVYKNRVTVSGSLSLTGGFRTPIKKVTTNYSFVTGSDFTVLFSGSTGLTGTLPSAAEVAGFIFNAKNITTNRLFITASSGMIEGSSAGISWNSKASYTFQSDGTDWYII